MSVWRWIECTGPWPHENQRAPPRDIAKLHCFRTKEQLMSATCIKDALAFQGHSFQLFQDLSPLTISKRHAIKPHLQAQQQHHIAYRWRFPFSVSFSFHGTHYTCPSTKDLQATLSDLHLLPADPLPEGSQRHSASRSPQKLHSSPDSKQPPGTHKWGCFNSPAPAQEDSMG